MQTVYGRIPQINGGKLGATKAVAIGFGVLWMVLWATLSPLDAGKAFVFLFPVMGLILAGTLEASGQNVGGLRLAAVMALAVVLCTTSDAAFAQSAAPPWETAMAKMACWAQGPWIKWAAVVAIALGGVMFGLGELNGPFKQLLQIAGGFSFAAGAVSMAALLIPTIGASLVCV